MINRSIKLPKKQSFFVFGPRQTGKTTLLQQLFPIETTHIYDLLKTEHYLKYVARPALIREEIQNRPSGITHILIDEVQKIPLLLDEVHGLMESPGAPHFILTGSSARKLKRSQANLLAGRALTYHLFPLTMEEMGARFSLSKALERGTLPPVYLEDDEEVAKERLRSYVYTYLKEEIETESAARQLNRFVQFLNIAAFANGCMLNYSNIARETGTSYQTVKSYYQILEDTLIGFFLYPFLKSPRKRLAHAPKFYFFDPGVVRALTRRLTISLEPGTKDYGDAFEHFVILEIMRLAEYGKMDLNFSYYHTEAGVEVDLVIETPRGELIAIEIKSAETIDSHHLRGLKSFAEAHPKARLYCIARVPFRTNKGAVTVLPYQDMMGWV